MRRRRLSAAMVRRVCLSDVRTIFDSRRMRRKRVVRLRGEREEKRIEGSKSIWAVRGVGPASTVVSPGL